MAGTKSISAVQEKWGRVTPQRAEDYTKGIANPRRPWAASAVAAKESHKAAMQAAATADSYAKGIQKAGDARWQDKASRKGPQRFAEGVTLAAPDYAAAFSPFLDTIAAVVPPPRFPRGDLRNLDRVKAYSSALRKKKTG